MCVHPIIMGVTRWSVYLQPTMWEVLLACSRCSPLKGGNCLWIHSNFCSPRFVITYRLEPTWKWSTANIHTGGNIRVTFLLSTTINQDGCCVHTPWETKPRTCLSLKLHVIPGMWSFLMGILFSLQGNSWLWKLNGMNILVDPVLVGNLDFGIPFLYDAAKKSEIMKKFTVSNVLLFLIATIYENLWVSEIVNLCQMFKRWIRSEVGQDQCWSGM